jgi:aspartate/methionine/tyrosine aminotransferase
MSTRLTDHFGSRTPEEVRPEGLADTRNALAAFLRVEPASVALTAGGAPAVGSAFMHALDLATNRCVLLPRPFYPQYQSLTRLLGCTVAWYRVTWDCGLDIQDFLHAIKSHRPALAVINTPHNPTGTVVSAGDLAAVINAAAVVSCRVIIDETFAGLEHSGPAAVLPAPVPGLVRVASLGKKFPRLSDDRVGYIVAAPDELSDLAVIHRGLSVGASMRSQRRANIVLADGPRLLTQTCKEISEHILEAAAAFENIPSARFIPPAAGIFARLDIGDRAPQEFAESLRQRAGFWCNPAATHGDSSERWIRLRLAAPQHVLAERWRCVRELLKCSRR